MARTIDNDRKHLTDVLRQAAEEMLDWHGSGMSVMEMSHRGKEFIAIHAEAEALLRELMAIPANYKVLFLQGGAIGENAIVPMNLLRGKASADYIHTGEWSKKSIAEAKKYARVNVAASGEAGGFTSVPARESWRLDPDAAYVHICSNETIGGVEYHWTPDTGAVPLVADMSSNILSRPVDVARYGLIYAGAQKNIGPAGLTIVILGFLIRLYRATPRGDGPLRLAIASVMGGALGNLVDRFRSPLGVVDFIDVGVGDWRWPTFNVADMGISCGAILLVVSGLLQGHHANPHSH